MAGEGATTGAKFNVGHGVVWVNGDSCYIVIRISRLVAPQDAGLTDSGAQIPWLFTASLPVTQFLLALELDNSMELFMDYIETFTILCYAFFVA